MEIETDVLIIGSGPAGSATAAFLSSYGIEDMVVNRYRWLANTPRAHITNQRTMEVLGDLGQDVEAEAYLHATEQDLMGENVFCESLAGEEIGRMKSWGTHPLSRAEHQVSSPSFMNDLPQTFMEPIRFSTACKRGTQARMSTEYVSHEQDAEGVTTTLRDRLSEREYQVRSKYLIGADGGNSLVAKHIGVPFEEKDGSAVVPDGMPEPAFEKDPELHYSPTTWPGARLPHVWVFDHETGAQHSTLDLCGKGQFTLLTGIGGEAWCEAAPKVSKALSLDVSSHVIGPRQHYVDHTGDWARTSETSDTGCILVRPDQHVAFRKKEISQDPDQDLMAALKKILSRYGDWGQIITIVGRE